MTHCPALAPYCRLPHSLPTETQLAYTHAALDALLSRTSNRRRMLSGYGLHGRGRGVGIWTVAADGKGVE